MLTCRQGWQPGARALDRRRDAKLLQLLLRGVLCAHLRDNELLLLLAHRAVVQLLPDEHAAIRFATDAGDGAKATLADRGDDLVLVQQRRRRRSRACRSRRRRPCAARRCRCDCSRASYWRSHRGVQYTRVSWENGACFGPTQNRLNGLCVLVFRPLANLDGAFVCSQRSSRATQQSSAWPSEGFGRALTDVPLPWFGLGRAETAAARGAARRPTCALRRWLPDAA